MRNTLGVERAVLLGHSHGGWVAQAYALRPRSPRPPPRGLVLYAATTPTTTAEWGADVAARMQSFAGEPCGTPTPPRRATRTDDEATAHFQQLAPFYFFDWTRRHAEFTSWVSEARDRRAPRRRVRRRRPHRLPPRASPKISAKALVLVGERDFVCSPRWSEELALGIPGARLVRFARSGHVPHLEEPEAFARVVVDFARGAAPARLPRDPT